MNEQEMHISMGINMKNVVIFSVKSLMLKYESEVKVTQLCLTLCDPLALSRPEYWSG